MLVDHPGMPTGKRDDCITLTLVCLLEPEQTRRTGTLLEERGHTLRKREEELLEFVDRERVVRIIRGGDAPAHRG